MKPHKFGRPPAGNRRICFMEKWIRARYLPGLPLGKDGRRVTAGKEHIALSRRAAREDMEKAAENILRLILRID